MRKKLHPEIKDEKTRKALVLREWRLKNPDKGKEASRRYYYNHIEQRRLDAIRYNKTHPEKVKNRCLKRQFGMTLKEYERIYNEQHGGCKICGYKQYGKMSLSVDHDHKTGRIRGLLCCYCNRKLGWFEKFEAVIVEYLNDKTIILRREAKANAR